MLLFIREEKKMVSRSTTSIMPTFGFTTLKKTWLNKLTKQCRSMISTVKMESSQI